jgi:hypothetical protein
METKLIVKFDSKGDILYRRSSLVMKVTSELGNCVKIP